MNARLSATLISLGVLISSASAAAATDNTPDFPVPSSCKQSSAAAKNKCFADMQKQWSLQQQAFSRKQLAEIKAWREANPQLVNSDWTIANIAFHQQLKDEALIFRNQQKADRQVFFDTYKNSVSSPDPHLTSSGNQPLLPGQAECFDKYQKEQSLPDWLQMCLRKADVDYRVSLRLKAAGRLVPSSSSSSSSSSSAN